MKSLRWYAHIPLLCALAGCLLTVPVSADDTIPWLTGNFSFVSGSGNQGIDGLYSDWQPPLSGFVALVPPTNLPNTTTEYCPDPPSCEHGYVQTIWDGSAVNGTVGFGLPPALGFSGWMTGGEITGWQVWFNCCSDNINEWGYHVTFRGTWNNGWWSDGVIDAHGSTTGDVFGSATMTTQTPEPGTVALLSTGILGGLCRWKKRGSLRR